MNARGSSSIQSPAGACARRLQLRFKPDTVRTVRCEMESSFMTFYSHHFQGGTGAQNRYTCTIFSTIYPFPSHHRYLYRYRYSGTVPILWALAERRAVCDSATRAPILAAVQIASPTRGRGFQRPAPALQLLVSRMPRLCEPSRVPVQAA
jgi:hypothetical protein